MVKVETTSLCIMDDVNRQRATKIMKKESKSLPKLARTFRLNLLYDREIQPRFGLAFL